MGNKPSVSKIKKNLNEVATTAGRVKVTHKACSEAYDTTINLKNGVAETIATASPTALMGLVKDMQSVLDNSDILKNAAHTINADCCKLEELLEQLVPRGCCAPPLTKIAPEDPNLPAHPDHLHKDIQQMRDLRDKLANGSLTQIPDNAKALFDKVLINNFNIVCTSASSPIIGVLELLERAIARSHVG